MDNETTFEGWALVELFGHTQIVGNCSTQKFGTSVMLRVDVPETGTTDGLKRQGFTKLFGMGAIYGITPLDQEAAIRLASCISAKPFSNWEFDAQVSNAAKELLPPSVSIFDEEESEF